MCDSGGGKQRQKRISTRKLEFEALIGILSHHPSSLLWITSSFWIVAALARVPILAHSLLVVWNQPSIRRILPDTKMRRSKNKKRSSDRRHWRSDSNQRASFGSPQGVELGPVSSLEDQRLPESSSPALARPTEGPDIPQSRAGEVYISERTIQTTETPPRPNTPNRDGTPTRNRQTQARGSHAPSPVRNSSGNSSPARSLGTGTYPPARNQTRQSSSPAPQPSRLSLGTGRQSQGSYNAMGRFSDANSLGGDSNLDVISLPRPSRGPRSSDEYLASRPMYSRGPPDEYSSDHDSVQSAEESVQELFKDQIHYLNTLLATPDLGPLAQTKLKTSPDEEDDYLDIEMQDVEASQRTLQAELDAADFMTMIDTPSPLGAGFDEQIALAVAGEEEDERIVRAAAARDTTNKASAAQASPFANLFAVHSPDADQRIARDQLAAEDGGASPGGTSVDSPFDRLYRKFEHGNAKNDNNSIDYVPTPALGPRSPQAPSSDEKTLDSFFQSLAAFSEQAAANSPQASPTRRPTPQQRSAASRFPYHSTGPLTAQQQLSERLFQALDESLATPKSPAKLPPNRSPANLRPNGPPATPPTHQSQNTSAIITPEPTNRTGPTDEQHMLTALAALQSFSSPESLFSSAPEDDSTSSRLFGERMHEQIMAADQPLFSLFTPRSEDDDDYNTPTRALAPSASAAAVATAAMQSHPADAGQVPLREEASWVMRKFLPFFASTRARKSDDPPMVAHADSSHDEEEIVVFDQQEPIKDGVKLKMVDDDIIDVGSSIMPLSYASATASEGNASYKRLRLMYTICLALVMAAACAIGLGVGLSGNNGSTYIPGVDSGTGPGVDPPSPPTDPPSLYPSESPSSRPTNSQEPSISVSPSQAPTFTMHPTATVEPSAFPTATPTARPLDDVIFESSYGIIVEGGLVDSIPSSSYTPDLIASMDLLAQSVLDDIEIKQKRRHLEVLLEFPTSIEDLASINCASPNGIDRCELVTSQIILLSGEDVWQLFKLGLETAIMNGRLQNYLGQVNPDSPLRIVDDTYVPPTLAPTPPNQMPTMSPATPPPNQMPTMSPVAPETPPPALVPTPVTPSPTSHPTESPTARPTALSLFNFLVGLSFDGGNALRNETSAQHRAFTWLSADQKVESYPNNVIVQRYVMATFYYSTNGDHWLMNDGWLEDGDECDWLDKSGKRSPCGPRGDLKNLELDFNNLHGTLPPELGLLSNSLERINLHGGPLNFVRGSIPSEYGYLTKIEAFLVRDNKLTGQIPTEIGSWGRLWQLDLSSNRVSGSLPSEIGNFKDLSSLKVSDNDIRGTIPTEIGNLDACRLLFLEKNLFTGAIPSELARMTKLQDLVASSNGFTSIPSEIGGLKYLDTLSMFENRLVGTLPSQIGLLHRLSKSPSPLAPVPHWLKLSHSPTFLFLPGRIDLHDNRFTGSLPTEIGYLHHIRGTFPFGVLWQISSLL